MLPRPVSMAAVLQRAQINTFARSYKHHLLRQPPDLRAVASITLDIVRYDRLEAL
jgi:hypothetical protein